MNSTEHYIRRAEHYRTSANRAFGRGFFVGFVSCAILVAAFIYGQRNAYGSEAPTPILVAKTRPAATTAMSNPTLRIDMAKRPPHWRTWVKIGRCEQPGRGWLGIAWHQTYNYGFPGGLGMTPLLWETFRRPSQRRVLSMASASPVEQLWAAERFWRWAERTYPGYGWTGWDCSRLIGWTTSDPRDAVR